MKRILCVLSSMNVGGAETFFMKLYRHIDREKYQFDFCVGGNDIGYYEPEVHALGGHVWHIPMKSKGIISFSRSFIRLLREQQFDAVIRLGDRWISGYELWLAKFSGVRIRALRSCNSNATMGKIGRALHYLLRVPMTSAANIKLAPSTEAAMFTFGPRQVKKGNVQLLNNAIQYQDYSYSENARIEIRREFGLKEKKVILHVGRMTHQKNHAFLIEVFQRVLAQIPDAILLLVGTGELQTSIQQIIKEKGIESSVILAGVRNDVPRFLSAADLFLLPSFYEGMPNTVIEAQAAGLPCIVSDTVTKEADITGLVTYASLREMDTWVEYVNKRLFQTRNTDVFRFFKKAQYDIDSVCARFTFLLFGERE